MKDMFPEYYEPDFDELWEQAIFVFDANALLDIFRFSPKASEELIEILEGLKDTNKIWIPHQFAYEYHKDMMSVRKDVKDKRGRIKKLPDDIKKELNQLSTRAGFKVNETHIKEIDSIFEKILQDLSNFENEYKSRGDGNHLAEKIGQLFADSVGKCDSDPRIKDISSIGKQRFDRKTPPGFKDANKPEPFGDLIGWFQMIAHAKKESKPLILVSNDRRGDDWFLKQNGQLKGGPRPELRKEMRNEAVVDFYLYTTEAFMKHAKNYLNSQVSNETIEEIEKHDRYISTIIEQTKQDLESLRVRIALRSYESLLVSMAVQDARRRAGLVRLAPQISGFLTDDDDDDDSI